MTPHERAQQIAAAIRALIDPDPAPQSTDDETDEKAKM